jgi:hypothetical protein
MITELQKYKQAFPDFLLDVEIPEGFVDCSWENEPCPSFQNKELELILYVDYADPDQREFADSERFSLVETANGMFTENNDQLINTNEWDKILLEIENRKASVQPAP